MNPIIRYSALFLLLLFVRVMVPDALLLSLHKHAHSEHATSKEHQQTKVEKKHKHCPVEDLFNAPFQGARLAELPAPVKHDTPYTFHLRTDKATEILYLRHLRGPPVV